MVQFEKDNYTVFENDSWIEACLHTSTNRLEREISVTLSTRDSSAVGRLQCAVSIAMYKQNWFGTHAIGVTHVANKLV